LIVHAQVLHQFYEIWVGAVIKYDETGINIRYLSIFFDSYGMCMAAYVMCSFKYLDVVVRGEDMCAGES